MQHCASPCRRRRLLLFDLCLQEWQLIKYLTSKTFDFSDLKNLKRSVSTEGCLPQRSGLWQEPHGPKTNVWWPNKNLGHLGSPRGFTPVHRSEETCQPFFGPMFGIFQEKSTKQLNKKNQHQLLPSSRSLPTFLFKPGLSAAQAELRPLRAPPCWPPPSVWWDAKAWPCGLQSHLRWTPDSRWQVNLRKIHHMWWLDVYHVYSCLMYSINNDSNENRTTWSTSQVQAEKQSKVFTPSWCLLRKKWSASMEKFRLEKNGWEANPWSVANKWPSRVQPVAKSDTQSLHPKCQ